MTVTPKNIEIREAGKEDIPKLIAMIGEVFEEYNMIYNSFDELPDFFDFDYVYHGRDNTLYVIEQNQTICGCGGFKFDEENTPYIGRVYVDRNHRRKGLGTTLVNHIEQQIFRLGFPEVYLWTDTRFTNAHRLYEKLGFYSTGNKRPLKDVNNSFEYEYRKHNPELSLQDS